MAGQGLEWSDLFEERTLFQIYLKSRSFLRNKFNAIVFGIALLGLSTFAVLHLLGFGSAIDFPSMFATWASAGIGYTANILGFLIAGFAVLFSVLRPATVLRLRSIPKRKGQKLDELKLMLVNFVSLFAHHIAFLGWCFVYTVAGVKSGPFEFAGQSIASFLPIFPVVVAHMTFVLWGLWFVVLALKVKSFVYNLYQTLLVVMIDGLDEPS